MGSKPTSTDSPCYLPQQRRIGKLLEKSLAKLSNGTRLSKVHFTQVQTILLDSISTGELNSFQLPWLGGISAHAVLLGLTCNFWMRAVPSPSPGRTARATHTSDYGGESSCHPALSEGTGLITLHRVNMLLFCLKINCFNRLLQ